MINGNSHQFLQNQINHMCISPNVLNRLTNKVLKRPESTLPTVNFEPEIFAPNVDVTKAKIAFGRWAVPKLRQELRHRNAVIVKQAISSLLDMAHDPEKAVEIISQGVIPWLVNLMQSEDAFVRKKTLELLKVLASQPGGKSEMVQIPALLHNVSRLMSDREVIIRLEAGLTLERLAGGYKAVRCLVKANFIPVIINCLEEIEEEAIVVQLLIVLELLLDLNDSAKLECLNNRGCELAVFLQHLNPKIRAKSAAVLTQLFTQSLGKLKAVEHRADILEMLTICLDDNYEEVKINSSAALMFALTTTAAKNRCLTLNLIPRLLHYTQASNCPDLQRNCIKALTHMAETPKGRATLLPVVDFLRSTDTKGNKNINSHLTTLIETILWLP